MIITMLAALSLAGVAARLAYRPRDQSRLERAAAAGAAIGFGALGLWLNAFIPFNFLHAPRPDQLSSALALGGQVLLPSIAAGSRRAAVVGLLLLSLAYWAKQTGAVASAVAAVWLLAAAAAGITRWRTAIGFTASLLLVNALVFALLEARTSGWASTFNYDIPSRQASVTDLPSAAAELLASTSAPLALAGALWVALSGRAALSRSWLRSRDGQTATVLALFALVAAAAALVFRQKQGTASNQFLGVSWALVLLAAMAHGLARRHGATAVASAAAVLALFALSESTRLQDALRNRSSRLLGGEAAVLVPDKSLRAEVLEVPAALRALARRGAVYHPVYSPLALDPEGPLYPGHANVEEKLAAGLAPGHLVRGLLDRRLDAVFLFQQRPGDERYASGYGKWEESFIWKLNEVIRSRYAPPRLVPPGLDSALTVPRFLSPYVSPGLVLRRPGPEPAPWMRRCFAPFEIAGRRWSIGRGGGFWCRPGAGAPTLELVRTPAGVSEVRSEEALGRRGGSVSVRLSRRGELVEVSCGGSLLRAEWRRADVVRLSSHAQGRAVKTLALPLRPGRRHVFVRVHLGGRPPGDSGAAAADRRRQLHLPADGGCVPRLRGSRLSRARFDLGALPGPAQGRQVPGVGPG